MTHPPWLSSALPITKEDEKKYHAISGNWLKLFAARRSLTEADCLKIIALELADKKRPEFIGRVKVWYNNLRSQRELNELFQTHPSTRKGIRG